MDKRYFNNNRLNNISCIMRKLIITFRDIKCKKRYCVLSDGVRSLTGINSDWGDTQALVDESISGSLGIVPIRITNLFNNTVSVLRVAVNSDETQDTDFIRQLQNQGGVTVQS